MIFILLFLIVHWYLSLFMQTFFHHRYASHRAFTMSRFWERFFYLTAYITQGSSYISPRVYAIMHRMHHAYTDTAMDPHSPANDRNIFVMMWHARQMTNNIYQAKVLIEQRFLKNLPQWRSLDVIAHSALSRLGWITIYVLIYFIFSSSAWLLLLLPIHILMVPIQGVIINWFAHKYGSINFKLKNTSTNLFKIDFLMMGEAYHNNHHKNPAQVNFGFKWFEMDATYFFIRLFNWTKIIRIPKH
ncbi:acyl-CoA desaturase [Ferruginibacter sp. SUN002]|uniref:acyl-CoA desaturase n=1 Tax=Ferruginibacter sp. SUN002 TaxID=2937789 RepID=UPI003D36CAD9